MASILHLFNRRPSPKDRFEALLRPHIELLYRMAYRWTGTQDRAEDLVQDVLVRLASRVEEMEAVEQLRPWLVRILYNRYVDDYRRQRLSPIDTRQSGWEPEAEEPAPDPGNRVELSDSLTDHLGLPRPKVTYRVRQDYERNAFVSAKQVSTEIFNAMGAREYTKAPPAPVFYGNPGEVTATNFQYQGNNFTFYGAGHIVGTYRMGNDKSSSVLNPRMQSWDHSNLYMAGSGVFPTVATGNPTLTIAALAFKVADHILEDLASI
ncbi:GMC oxidoreductase [Cellvibrio japonicus]|uniref:GMC oxidoreductase n=1 Tax=Cellvibrio japonicus TaxID=155077 RepID=UPI0005A056FE|nr:GMC oxidoreductase [Cellvibrio japonicus]QEI13389.1 hypothetical protein FY117_14935 [Cellvibrio japonicus]QEI16963.1 hypothetical protein FY116_14940 [Cellvibrio japonicus]QEI20541.1 hypothetical protein FY115_14935 [Cellvibrio japonicus]